jgi:hypothetical protein
MATIPALALIPSAYKASKVYSVLPNNGNGDFTFSRTGTATRVNKDGIIETVASDVPRLDYSDGSCPALLLEPQRTNVITYSEDFGTFWVETDSVLNNNYASSPTGEFNAYRFIDNNAGGLGNVSLNKTFVLTTDTTYTFSVFAKKDQVNFISLRTGGFSAPSSGNTYFDIENGALGNVRPDHTANIKDYGNGWYRCSITFSVSGADATGILAIYANEQDNVITSQRDNTTSVLLFGAQLEAGNYPTSYIPTTGSAVTRSADSCLNGGNSDLFDTEEGVLYAELQTLANEPTNRYVSLSDGVGSPYTNSLSIQYRSDGAIRVYLGGLGTSNLLCIISSVDATNINKIAVRFKDGDMAVYLNGINQSLFGGFVYTNVTGLNQLSFHQPGINTNLFYGKCKDIRIYNEALTDTELATLTSL